MPERLRFQIAAQPDEVTCGPTCLHGIYRYLGDDIGLQEVIGGVDMLSGGGTLDVFLANHALGRGYRVSLFTYNLHLFDPTWALLPVADLISRLEAQAESKDDAKLRVATSAYIRFLELGGKLRFEDLRPALIRRILGRGVPIMTGLSATYLYQSRREIPETNAPDDVRGEPAGHFVVLSGYHRDTKLVDVADPYEWNPLGGQRYYTVDLHRLIGAVLLGSLTYDANLLVIEKTRRRRWPR
ncbi:MAG: C39 family peptidase [Gammaproteobacteria bacterium]|nr:C39 family peptidase [Gammaproteobacteria bacterium]MDH5275766.1 C39 family peptidase [Gammaproteobacteria bacterium]